MGLGETEARAGVPPARELPAKDLARSVPSVLVRAAVAGLEECV